MRLIDADRLKAVVDKNFYGTAGADVMQQLINSQPTTYDVDKVVEQLEKRKCSDRDAKEDIDCKVRNRHIDMCIRVVKGGGRDE